MGIIADLLRLFDPPTVTATRYRCLACDVTLEDADSVCPDCGNAAQKVNEAVAPRYGGPYS